MEKYKCDSIFKDPCYKGYICNKEAKYMVKLETEKEYIHPRCGTHAKKMDKVELYIKNKRNINKNEKKVKNKNNNDFIFNLEELLEYIESEKCKTDIPTEIQNLFNEIDKLNDDIISILRNR